MFLYDYVGPMKALDHVSGMLCLLRGGHVVKARVSEYRLHPTVRERSLGILSPYPITRLVRLSAWGTAYYDT